MCNDLERAAQSVRMLGAEGTVDLSPTEKVEEMLLFSVSEAYFELREALGIQIGLAR